MVTIKTEEIAIPYVQLVQPHSEPWAYVRHISPRSLKSSEEEEMSAGLQHQRKIYAKHRYPRTSPDGRSGCRHSEKSVGYKYLAHLPEWDASPVKHHQAGKNSGCKKTANPNYASLPVMPILIQLSACACQIQIAKSFRTFAWLHRLYYSHQPGEMQPASHLMAGSNRNRANEGFQNTEDKQKENTKSVGREGIEPSWGCPQWILSPQRMPFRHRPIS